MKGVDLYARVRRAVYVEGMSQRGAARYFGIDPRTVAKMMRFSVPPGYRRSRPPARPKLDRFTGIIDQILDDVPRYRPSSGIPRSGSSSGCVTSTGTGVATRRSRITCGCVGSKGARCSCRCGIRQAMAKWILAKRWR